MSSPKENDPKIRPLDALEEDDAIIELVDEVEDESISGPISPLEKQLLGLTGQPATRSADALDSDGIRFDEEDEGRPASPPTRQNALSLSEAEKLLSASPDPTGASNEIEEIAEFDEQFLEPEDVAGPTPEGRSRTPEAEPIELIEAEEEELDNELLWFDDLKEGTESPAAAPPTGLAEHEEIELILPEDADLGPTTAADVFSAHLESLFPESNAPGAQESEEGISLTLPEDEAAAPPISGLESSVLSDAAPPAESPVPEEPAQPVPVPAPAAALTGIPPEEIEAAVERVIERKLGGTIEATILRVIETAVTREIERIKQLLLEDDRP